ncbi:MAG: nitrate/nitrite transporter NrtS [Pseudomonadota bacterium]
MWWSRPVVGTAIRVSLVVGLVLNLINQGPALFGPDPVVVWQVALNFLVPYLVSSYSASRQALTGSR